MGILCTLCSSQEYLRQGLRHEGRAFPALMTEAAKLSWRVSFSANDMRPKDPLYVITECHQWS